MKLRFPISPPRREDGTLLAAGLAGLLVVTAGLQLLWVGDEPLPAEGVGRVAPVGGSLAVARHEVSPIILARPLFSPTRGGAGGGAGSDAPLGGAVVAGMVARGRAAQLFLRAPDGVIHIMHIGEDYAGWRLAGLANGAARFVGNGQTITIPFGSAAAPAAAHGQDPDEDDSNDE